MYNMKGRYEIMALASVLLLTGCTGKEDKSTTTNDTEKVVEQSTETQSTEVYNGKIYTYDDAYSTAAFDVEAKIIDEQTGIPTDESIMIRKSDRVKIISTDSYSWCDVRTADGYLARVTFDRGLIDGKMVFLLEKEE